jgi:YgiT-type zinc finger domain-containing protein
MLDEKLSETKMKCVVCKSPDVKKKMVEEELKVGSDIALYNIEVMVCGNCGERYYDRKTLTHLEELKEKLKEKKVGLEVVGKVLRVSGTPV